MGKVSTLKNNSKDTGTRYSYPNGDRKAYEKDSCPPGYDEIIWHLALLYRDCCLELGCQAEGMPILYTEIYDRGLTDLLLGAIIGSGSPADDLVRTAEEIVSLYFDTYDSNSAPRISDFIFRYPELKSRNLNSKHHAELLKSGVKTVQVLPAMAQDRRTDWEKERARIISTAVDEETARRKIEGFIKAAAV
jgi:hypothetical protein